MLRKRYLYVDIYNQMVFVKKKTSVFIDIQSLRKHILVWARSKNIAPTFKEDFVNSVLNTVHFITMIVKEYVSITF